MVLGAECTFGGEHKNVLTNCEAKNGFSAFRAKLEKHFKIWIFLDFLSKKVKKMLRFIFLYTSLPFNMLLCIESVEFDWFTLIFSHQPPAEIFTNWLYFWNILKIGFDRCFCYFANISFSFFFFLNFWQLRFRFAKICIVRKYNKIQNVHVLKIYMK